MGDEDVALRKREEDQDLPVPNDQPNCQQAYMDWVAEVAPERMALGLKRYGTLLQPFNGRDFMRDAFDELFDLSVYMHGIRIERARMLDLLREAATVPTSDPAKVRRVQLEIRELLSSMGHPVFTQSLELES